jgi:hypothetical protein
LDEQFDRLRTELVQAFARSPRPTAVDDEAVKAVRKKKVGRR